MDEGDNSLARSLYHLQCAETFKVTWTTGACGASTRILLVLGTQVAGVLVRSCSPDAASRCLESTQKILKRLCI